MSSQKDADNPQRPPRERSSSTKKTHRADRTSRGKVAADRQAVQPAASGDHDEQSSVADTPQKTMARHVLLYEPESKEIGVFSAALVRKEKEEAAQAAIQEERGSGAEGAKQKRQNAQGNTRNKSGQQPQSPTRLQAEENRAVQERKAEASLEVSGDQFAKRPPYRQPPAPVAPPHHASLVPKNASMRNQYPPQLIEVRYQNTRAGEVDDITLDELIESKQISHFYRPSEEKWVEISVDPVRERARTNTTGLWRRASDGERKDEAEEKPHGALSGLFRRHAHHIPPKKKLTAQEWFQLGFVALHTTDDCAGAPRAFAMSIQLDPTYERAYVNRALAYERLGNIQQAIEDYSTALLLNPGDAKVYYLRGLALKRLGMGEEAITDLKKAADLRFRPAYDFLKSIGMSG